MNLDFKTWRKFIEEQGIDTRHVQFIVLGYSGITICKLKVDENEKYYIEGDSAAIEMEFFRWA